MISEHRSEPSSPLVPRERFVAELREACARRTPYAAGKLARAEREWLRYPIVLERIKDSKTLRALELAMANRSLKSSGIFPADPEFYRRWAGHYLEAVAQLDSIGIVRSSPEEPVALLEYYQLDSGRLIDYKDQEPDRSSPSDESRCYLPAFRNRDILLVCPFGEFLAARATCETFEAVWAKTGKRWFAPRSAEGLEFPYGYDAATQRRFGTALDLLEYLKAKLLERQFDIALIAAGGLGVPLASFVKSQGRVGLSIGGHLQVLFGVLGARWRDKESWRRRYFNDAWVELPRKYVPDADRTIENYW
jgi:hypothetical protein